MIFYPNFFRFHLILGFFNRKLQISNVKKLQKDLIRVNIVSKHKNLIKLIVLVALIAAVLTGVLRFHFQVTKSRTVKFPEYLGNLTADYTASIMFSKVLLLQESYSYHVNAYRYKILYRLWNAPVTIKKEAFPCIVLKLIGDGENIIYFNYSHIYVSNLSAFNIVKRLTKRNELGIICNQYPERGKLFKNGSYSLSAFYEVYPPIQTDGRYDHVNLKLADKHVSYTSVKIYIYDPNNTVLKIYPHMKEYSLKKIKNGWLIESNSSSGPIGVEFLLKHGAIKGFYQNVSNVLSLVGKAGSAGFGGGMIGGR